MAARNSLALWLVRSLLVAGTFGALLAPLALGFFASRLNFTYGTRGLDPSERWRAAIMVALWIAAGIAFEAVFRRGLLQWLRARRGIVAAMVLHLIVLNVVFWPLRLWYGARTDVLTTWEVLLYENLLQILFASIYISTGSFALTGAVHGLFAALRFTVINDVSGPFETLFFYSYSDAAIAWLLTLSPLLGSLWLGIVSWAFELGPGLRRAGSARAQESR
jgi:hypothetical protein